MSGHEVSAQVLLRVLAREAHGAQVTDPSQLCPQQRGQGHRSGKLLLQSFLNSEFPRFHPRF